MKILANTTSVQVKLEPGEILHWPIVVGRDFTDAIRAAAWKKLFAHAKKQMEGKLFLYGDVEFVDGLYSVTFYHEPVKVPKEPPAP